MNELEQLRSSANLLLTKAQEGSSLADLASAVEKATAVQRLMADLESSRAALRKAELEETKLRHDNETAAARERSERHKDYVTLLAPLLTVITLAATLIAQNYQFVMSEKDKNEAASDAQWQEALRTISQATQLPPALVTLQPFLVNPRYANRARLTAVQLAINGTDPQFFDELMGIAFIPPNLTTLDDLLKIDRGIYSKAIQLYEKSWDQKEETNDMQKLTPYEQTVYRYVDSVMPKLTTQIGAVLKLKRPDNVQLDLSDSQFKYTDWSGIDLSSANLENARFNGMDLKNANLSQITRFTGAAFYYTAWWEASSISQNLLSYLQSGYPCNPNAKSGYGPRYDERVTKAQCDAELERLRKASGL